MRKSVRVTLLWCATFAVIGITMYPIAIYPMMHPEKYREIQKFTRKDIKQEDIQPGNMNIWRDPFDRK